jgi:pimeloyl-ACP methyl ester carboxylesterase/DNA-binding CsgD family transcriptional regulator
MRTPETRYAKNGSASIAYQVLGQGTIDFLVLPGFVSNLEIQWEDPDFNQWARRLATFTRLILMDRRGTGLSDRHVPASDDPTSVAAHDVLAVLDATGSGRAALCGGLDCVPTVVRFASTYPGRVRSVICYAPSTVQSAATVSRVVDRSWGIGESAQLLASEQSQDPRFRARWARFERLSASPSEAGHLFHRHDPLVHAAQFADVTVPMLFLHRGADTLVPSDRTRDLAKAIPGARFVQLSGKDHLIWSGNQTDLTDAIESFLTGAAPRQASNQVLATLLAARLPNMERIALRLGEARWLSRIQRFKEDSDEVILANAGQSLTSAFATWNALFESPAMSIRAALAMRDLARSHDLPIAVGLHLGEINRESDPCASRAFMIAHEIAGQAKADELIASRVVVDVVTGVGLRVSQHAPLVINGLAGPINLVGIAAEQHLEPAHLLNHEADLSVLSARECQVLKLVAGGLSNAAIAGELRLSVHTVKRHVSNILLKLDLPTRVAAAVLSEHLSA